MGLDGPIGAVAFGESIFENDESAFNVPEILTLSASQRAEG
jgi:hypothetical protein